MRYHVTRYYLGVPVSARLDQYGQMPEWVWCEWPDGKRWRHWGDQLKVTPWAAVGPKGDDG